MLDPVIIAQLGNLQLRARRILDGLYSGQHINRNRGNSKEFSQHRPYNTGDDLKGLDWKVFGRTDRLVIKQYEEETNIVGTIVIDDSASMNFSWDGRPSKLEYAKTMAAALAYLLVSQHDAIGLVSSKTTLPLSSHRGHLDQVFKTLSNIEAKGEWNIRSLVENISVPLKKRGFVMVFSDLMAEAETVISALRALHARKHEVMIFQILDPIERTLQFNGPVLFEDSETNELLKTEPEVIQQAYQKIIKDRLASFSQAFRRSGIDYQVLTTDTPFEKGMGAFLSWRGVMS